MSEKSLVNSRYFLIFSFGVLGFTALIFQVVFVRNLVLLFGLTAPAVSTVLAVFFFGLALGSLIFGNLADRWSASADQRGQERRPTRTEKFYILLFVLTAAYGFLFPFIFKLLNGLILAVNSVWPLNFSGFNFFAFLFSFIFLSPPAVLFGAGFPVINKILIHREEEVGKRVSFLYFINTFGSVLGALAAGFWLIPAFGNNATIFTASGLALIVGGLLFVLLKPRNLADFTRKDAENIPRESASGLLFLIVLFITGFLALALEVLYTKTLILFIGSSTYAFSLILITFLLGIALGSWVLSLFADKIQRGYAYFGVFLGLIGFWLFLTLQFFEKVPFWYLQILGSYESFGFGATLLAQAFIALLVIFPVTFLMGIIFPLGIKLAGPDMQKLGSGVGKLYFANTFGGVFGSLTAGFVLLPNLGYARTLTLILLAYFLLAGIFVAYEKKLDRIIKGVIIFFSIFWSIFGILSLPWSPNILSMGNFPYALKYSKFNEQQVQAGARSDQILFYREGQSNVAVVKKGNDVFLRINGKVDASNGQPDLEAEILIGALPMLFHPDPKEVLVVGLGAGITLGTVTQFDSVQNIDVVEIDPAIIKAAEYFKEDNHDALNNPRVKTILSDARNYLYLNSKKYDVISSEPSNLWVSGNAYLFSKEYYESAKTHLKENGLMLQWIHIYSLAPEDLRTIINTFGEVFPGVYLFDAINSSDLFLVGSLDKNGSILDFNRIENKFGDSKIRDELERIYIANPYELLSYFTAGNDNLRELTRGAKVNTDNRPILEFSAPKSIYQETVLSALDTLLDLRKKTNISDFIRGGDREEISRYFSFRQKLIPIRTALYRGVLDDALDSFRDADILGLFHPFVANDILRLCAYQAEKTKKELGEEEAEEAWRKCEIIFSE